MAAYEETMKTISVPAGSDLSTKQFLFVKINSSKQLAVCVADDLAVGVLQDKPSAAGRPGRVCIGGVTMMQFGGSVTAGATVVSDANGKAVASGSSDGQILGTAPEGGSAGGLYPLIFAATGK